MSAVMLRNELSWWTLAKRGELRPAGIGGKRITERRPPRAKRILAPESEAELREAYGK